MLPLARTHPGVRGAVRPGLLSLRTVSAVEWRVGRDCWPAPCRGQGTVRRNPLHVSDRASVPS
ncbi:hypothetical protein PIB30_116383, partial [Stylosanthes scabra]|nr:hypothetical protein [Stylosanthes scabra]